MNLQKRAVFSDKQKIIDDPTYLFHIVATMILNVNNQFGASKQNPVVIACDSKPSWRNSFYVENSKDFPEYLGETYKGDRKPDDSIDWKTIGEISDSLVDAMRNYTDFHVVKVEGCEADDIIAVLAKDCLKRKEQCWIVSMDKDFRQLQQEPYISIYDPIKKLIVPKADAKRYLQLHIMTAGDDNIKNIAPRMGNKTAEKILPMITEYLALNPEAKKRYNFNKVLIDFNCIPLELQEKVLEDWNKEEHSFNALELVKVFRKYKANAVGQRISSFQLRNMEIVTPLNSYHSRAIQQDKRNESTLINFFE